MGHICMTSLHDMIPAALRPTTITHVDGIAVPTCRPVFKKWMGVRPAFTFGKKPLIDYHGTPLFAELAILRLFPAPWAGAWTETFGGATRFWCNMPTKWETPSDTKIPLGPLSAIWKQAAKNVCLDLFLHNGDDYLFVEAKRYRKDKPTKAEVVFFQAASACGVPAERLLIVEWDFEQPRRGHS
jgi:hypothetical protein